MEILSAEDFFEIRGCLAPLGAMGLIHDHSAAPCGEDAGAPLAALLSHLQELPRNEGELLQRGDDDGDRVLQRSGELLRALLNLLHYSALVLELVDGVLELLVEHHAIGDDDDAVENPFVCLVVERSQPVGEPANRVALAAARRVLNQVVMPHALFARRLNEPSHSVELMVAREDHRLDLDLPTAVVSLLLGLQVDKAREQVQKAVAPEHFLPQVSRPVAAAVRVGLVARTAIAALVEGQEMGRRPREPGRHAHVVGVGGEVDERTAA